MFAHLDELVDERSALQSFFDQHEMLIEDEAFDLLLPVSPLVDNGEPSTKQVMLFSETWFFAQQ